jgi:hypothetical protein
MHHIIFNFDTCQYTWHCSTSDTLKTLVQFIFVELFFGFVNEILNRRFQRILIPPEKEFVTVSSDYDCATFPKE